MTIFDDEFGRPKISLEEAGIEGDLIYTIDPGKYGNPRIRSTVIPERNLRRRKLQSCR